MIQFIKTRDVKSPLRNAEENAGIDFYIPENNDDFIHDLAIKNPDVALVKNVALEPVTEMLKITDANRSFVDEETGKIYVAPRKDILIPSGIKSKFPNSLALVANNKSGIATKKKLVFGASVIDASYQGEWHLHLINTSDSYQEISCGTKVIQFIPHLISTDELARLFYVSTSRARQLLDIFYYNNGFGCAAFCERKNDLRHFDLSRIKSAVLMDEFFR